MGISTYLQEALLKHLYRNTDLARSATLYVSLHTADPTDAGTGAEVSTSGTGYARQAVDTGAGSEWTAPASLGGGMGVTNANDVTFGPATGSWGTVAHAAIWDTSTSGNMLHYGPLGTSKTITSGDSLVIDAGDLEAILKSS
jgi:hypothetical protein